MSPLRTRDNKHPPFPEMFDSPVKKKCENRTNNDKKSRLRKKLSKQETPKHFLKLKRGETLP